MPTGLASLIIATVPLWVILLRLLARERIPRGALIGVLAGFAGVAILLRPSGDAPAVGLALCVLSALMWALGSFLSARLPLPKDVVAATTYEMLCGGAVMLPLGLVTMGELEPSGRSVAAWLYLVVFGSLVAYTAYVWLLAHAPLGTVATYAYVNPVVAIALGFLVRDEELTPQILLGAAIVVASVAVVVRREAPEANRRSARSENCGRKVPLFHTRRVLKGVPRGSDPVCSPWRGRARQPREHQPAREREERCERNAARQELADTDAANATGATTPTAESTVCCRPIAAPLRRPPSSAAIVNDSPFQAIESAVATSSTGTTSHTPADSIAAASPSATAAAAPTSRSGRSRDRIRSDQRPSPILSAAATTCAPASTAAASPGEKPRSSCR